MMLLIHTTYAKIGQIINDNSGENSLKLLIQVLRNVRKQDAEEHQICQLVCVYAAIRAISNLYNLAFTFTFKMSLYKFLIMRDFFSERVVSFRILQSF